MTRSQTPTSLAGFTPAWMTSELRRSGTIGSEVLVTAVDCSILGAGEGFMGTVARLTLTYNKPGGPVSMIAKIPTSDAANRATGRTIGVYEREVRIYADVLPSIDVPQPKVYSAIYEADGHEVSLRRKSRLVNRLPVWLIRRLIWVEQGKSKVPPCVLLIEDIGDAEIGDQINGGTTERITAALTTLARLHASTWGASEIPKAHWSEGADVVPRVLQAMYCNGRAELLKQAGSSFSPHSVALYESLEATGVDRVRRHQVEVPQALLHADYRLDNLFFGPDGEVRAVIDWQTATPGPVVVDVGYLMMSSVAADVPESAVDDLLRVYHGELVARGVVDYTFEQFHADYLDGLLIVLHRLTGAADLVDFGEGRGVELLDTWFKRVDARLTRVTA